MSANYWRCDICGRSNYRGDPVCAYTHEGLVEREPPAGEPTSNEEVCPHGYLWRACRECRRADAARYMWLRKHACATLIGLLIRDGDSLREVSGQRLDSMIDLRIGRGRPT